MHCPECKAKVEQIECEICRKCFPKNHWDKNQLKRLSERGEQIRCKSCAAAQARHQTQVKSLQIKMKGSSVYCKCSQLFGHAEKCPLHRVTYGKIRFPGSDGHLTEDEIDFLNNLNPRPGWWAKALRKVYKAS